MSYPRSASIVLLLLIAMLIASCGTGTNMTKTITIEQAENRVEDYFHEALAILPAQARPVPGLIDTYDCDDPTDNGPKGRKITSVHYYIQDLPPAEYGSYVVQLERWWQDHNFRILDDERPVEESIWVENNDDGFRMRVTATDKGKFILIATSPCVWTNGTPE
jgi:hypothetical protein